MKTYNAYAKIIILALVFGLLAAPLAFAAEDKDDNPLYNIKLPDENSSNQYLASYPDMVDITGPAEVKATAAFSEEGDPSIIRDFNLELIGPQWERVPGKNE